MRQDLKLYMGGQLKITFYKVRSLTGPMDRHKKMREPNSQI